MRRLLALILGFALLSAACSSEDAPAATTPEIENLTDPAPSFDPPPQDTTPAESDPVDESLYLFDQEQLHTFELNLSEENYAYLDEAPDREEYVEGTMTFEGETLPVGIRYKGSIGAFLGCVDGNDADPTDNPANIAAFLNTSGAKTCTKLSIKVKTNWEDSNDEFLGQRKLQFHSMNNDDSQMRDRLAYALYADMGVAAPRATHARLVINGEYQGLYAMVEQIDGRFTRRNYEDGTGNLYKEVWPLRGNGSAVAAGELFGGLKTNEDEDPSFDLMLDFAAEIADASPDEAKAVIEKWMDVDAILAQMVVDRTIRHDDGPTHWRCAGGSNCFTHNFYWYMDPTTEKAHLIPWDLDASFISILFDAPIVTVYDGWGEITDDCAAVNHGGFIAQRSAACDPLFAAWALFEEEYDALLAEFIAGPFSEENITAKLDAWEAQIADATAEAAALYDDALPVAEWQGNIDFMHRATTTARDEYFANH